MIDEFTSYTALRSVNIQRDRFMLNGRPYLLRMVLDQGYWPDTLLAAPDDAALAARRRAGQGDGLQRRAQAPEDRGPALPLLGRPAGAAGVGGDALGLPLHAHGDQAHWSREWREAIERDYSHPCIIVWVPFNESWGVPDLTAMRRSGTRCEALYHLTKTLDADAPGDRQRRLGVAAPPTSSASTTTTPTPSTSASAMAPRYSPSSCSTGAGPAGAS